MAEIIRNLNHEEAPLEAIQGNYFRTREAVLPSPPEPTFPVEHVTTENQSGSRWSIGEQTATYICACGNTTQFFLSAFGKLPVAKCCKNALAFPLER